MPFTLSQSAFLALIDSFIMTEHNSKLGASAYTRKNLSYYTTSGQEIFKISNYKEKDTRFILWIRPESIREILDIFEVVCYHYKVINFSVNILTPSKIN